ncbi:MAG TPA: HAMP domain-containing sensor histidine kinase [Fimbriimonadaceae bacterium]|nr:HAMP domain-containing sensor histidine kinase [Fimbriimonadaceae bacterium]
MRTFLRSFRGRLVLVSTITLGLALVGFSTVLSAINISRLEDRIERELMDRGRMLAHPPMPPNRGFRPGVPRPPDPFAQEPGPRPPGPPPSLGDREADFVAAVRRPRFLPVRRGPVEGEVALDPRAAEECIRLRRHLLSTITFREEPVRVLSVPVVRDRELVGVVQVARELREVQAMRETQWRTLLALLPGALLVAGLGALLLARGALAPLAKMQEATAAIGAGDLERRLEVRGEDELAEVARSFNEMTENLARAFAAERASYRALEDAYEGQRRFTADASHELRTPLTRLQVATSGALASNDPERNRHALEIADAAATSMSNLVRHLLTLARADAGQLHLRMEPLDLRVIVAAAVDEVGREVHLELPPEPVTLAGDEDHLRRVLANLLQNACRHTPPDAGITVSLAVEDERVSLTVEDQGEGIEAAHLPHVFERFYRADAARTGSDSGAGLGLAICKSIVEAHGGQISIESSLGRGTRVRIMLPLMKSS